MDPAAVVCSDAHNKRTQQTTTNSSLIRALPSAVCKMSTMLEEDCAADELNADVNSATAAAATTADEERCSLLAGNRKIAIANSSAIVNSCNSPLPRGSCDSNMQRLDSTTTNNSQLQGSSQSGIYDKKSNLEQQQPSSGKSGRLLELNNGNKAKYPSLRSLKSGDDQQQLQQQQQQHLLSVNQPNASWASIVYSDSGSNVTGAPGKPFPESVSIRSLASIGMGSSDGRKLTIRKVPTSPSELLNMVHPPT